MKTWSRGRCWDVVALGRKEVRVLLTVHDAPEWVARQMLCNAEMFVAPLQLIPVDDCNAPKMCGRHKESQGGRVTTMGRQRVRARGA